MLIRALKEEPTEVKMLYLATYCIVVSGLAMVIDGRQWTRPSTEQALLLLGCGAPRITPTDAVSAPARVRFPVVKAVLGAHRK